MYDVIVIGLGGMGSAIAYHLARRGRRVLGLDRFTPPHDFGSSHGRSRIIRQAYFEHPAYVPLVLRAYELWRALEKDAGEELLVETGGLMIGTPDSEVVAGTTESAQQHGLSYRMLSPEDVGRWFPAFRLEPDEVAVYEESAGVLFPERCVEAHLRLARQAGAELRFGEPVESWVAGDSSVSVRTSSGRYQAERLVLAAGPWNPDLLGMELSLEVERQVSCWFRPAERPEWFEERFPIFVWQLDGERALYGLPGLQGEGIKVGFHHGGETGHPDRLSREVGSADVEPLREVLRRRLPLLDGEPERAAVCFYTNTPDKHFLLGVHPQHAPVVIAGGCSGHAFKFCPVIGEAVADLVEGKERRDLALFDPRRLLA
ncbi:MAG TPA: N-methyl-L-tryptophan oxidase [Thermaerobacter sp.]